MHQERRWYQIDSLCRTLRVSRGGYYAWLRGCGHHRERVDAVLLKDIRRIHENSERNYGSPRVYRDLRKRGVSCSKARVERLMRENALRAKHKRKFKVTTDSNHNLPVAPNVLSGRFDWPGANQAWVGDITYIPTDEGGLAVLGSVARPVLSTGRRLGYGQTHDAAPAIARPKHGDSTTASSAGIDSSHRPRQPICQQ